MAKPEEEYVTILAISSDNYACIIDQVKYSTSYKRAYGISGPSNPLSGHFSHMRRLWPNWIIISKESWEQKYGKIVYP